MQLSIVLIFLQLQYCFGSVLVEVKQGRIKGKSRKDRLGNDFYSFQSIPYAKPPINELRFKAPQPPNSWIGTLDGTKDLPQCYQRTYGAVGGQEDCLYLNVYTKKINANNIGELLPVMVYIHGGSLLEGSARENILGPEHLLVEDIVLVVINYRLGIFGFLNFEDQTAGVPGNAGFKDQVMALKWVKKNINKFGGNSNRVTIFGQSSGAGSVHLHVLSPMSKGLFQRAILQSGTGISQYYNGVLGTGKLLADTLGIESDDPKEILRQLRDVPTEKIFESQEKFFSQSRIYDRVHASPIIETQTNEPAFLADKPINILRSGTYNKVPLMIGYTSSEAIFFYVVAYFGASNGHVAVKLNESIPFDLNILNNSKLVKEVVNELQTFYFGGKTPTDEDIFQNIKLLSSIWFVYPALLAINEHLNNLVHPIYFYIFSADTKLNLFKRSVNETATYPGAGHADELPYLFNFSSVVKIEKDSVEEKSVERMVKLWTNFAKFGKPVPANDNIIDCAWEPTVKEKLNYLDIGTYGLTKRVKPNADDYNFWKSIYRRYTQK